MVYIVGAYPMAKKQLCNTNRTGVDALVQWKGIRWPGVVRRLDGSSVPIHSVPQHSLVRI